MAGVNGYGGRQRRDEEPENNPVTGQIGNESITDRNRRVFGKAAPDGESVKAFEQGLRNNQISREAEAAGQSGETAVASTGTGLDSWGPNGPKTLGLNRLPQAKSPMGGGGETAGETVSFKSSGEEYMYKAKNAIRALQGLPPVAQELNPRDKFQVDVEKSISFGDKSGLLTPTGHVKAFESGIRAGYSTDEVNGMLQGARDRLKPKDDSKVLSDTRKPSTEVLPSNTTGVLKREPVQPMEGNSSNTVGVIELTDKEKVEAEKRRVEGLSNTTSVMKREPVQPMEGDSSNTVGVVELTDNERLEAGRQNTLGNIDAKKNAVAQRDEDRDYNTRVLKGLSNAIKGTTGDMGTAINTLLEGGSDNEKAYDTNLTRYSMNPANMVVSGVTAGASEVVNPSNIIPPRFKEAAKALNDTEALKEAGFDPELIQKILDNRTEKFNLAKKGK